MVVYVTEVAEEYEREGYKEELIQRFVGGQLCMAYQPCSAEDLKLHNTQYIRRNRRTTKYLNIFFRLRKYISNDVRYRV